MGLRPFFGLATPDWGDKLIQSEQVGGRAHESLFGAVAVLLTATMALTVSRATLSNGVGGLKCYDKGGIEKAC